MHSKSRPPDLLTPKDVATLVNLPLKKLTFYVYGLREGRRYDRFTIARRSGGEPREIHAPIKPIKDVQHALLNAFAGAYDPTLNVHGYVPGRSPVSNARPHQRQTSVLRVDLKDFFPSIHFGRVRGIFMKFPFDYPDDVAQLLAHICCYRGALPQGAPTSPLISNLVCRRLDRELASLAKDERCYFTRYADDLCFSTRRRVFPNSLADDSDPLNVVTGRRLRDIIEGNGFEPNEGKTRLVHYAQRQRVTGLVVNAHLNVSRDYVRDLRSLLYIWRRYGEADAAAAFLKRHGPRNAPPDTPFPALGQTIAGRIQYVGSIKGWGHPVYRRLANDLSLLYPSFRPRTLQTLHKRQRAVIYTEGKTDPMHFLAAQKHFHANGEFTNLILETVPSTIAGSGKQLLEDTEALAKTRQQLPTVSIFDRDEPKVVDEAVGATGVRVYRNRVGAVSIVHPEWRDTSRPICVEMLYRDEDLRKVDSDSRRIYLRDEFHPKTGYHLTEHVYTPNMKNTTLVRDEVYAPGSDKSLALSKIRFAERVSGGVHPYDSVDFEGFRPTFEAIQDLVARLL